jgi:hypothetical protein
MLLPMSRGIPDGRAQPNTSDRDRSHFETGAALVRLLGRYLNSKTEVDRISRLGKRAASGRVERVSPPPYVDLHD